MSDTTNRELRRAMRRVVLSEIDLYQYLRGRRAHASRFSAWPLTRAAVRDKRAAARRLRVHLVEMIHSLRAVTA